MSTTIDFFNADQIGGCVTVISCNNSRIVIDYGSDLPGSENKSKLNLNWDEVNAVIFTHYHGDHIGRIDEIPDDVNIYMYYSAYRIMQNIWALVNKDLLNKLEKRKKQSNPTLFFLDDKKTVEIGNNADIKVTSFSVDHSAYDACMLLVETADKKRILHTGDFRTHGYQGDKVLPTIKEIKNTVPIDILIIEGTMMSRVDEKVMTEQELQEEAKKIADEHNGCVFLICSSTNLDTLASFNRAINHGNRFTYTYSEYLQIQLNTLSEIAGTKNDIYKFDNVYTLPFTNKPNSKWDSLKSQEKWMKENGFLAIIKPEDYCSKFVDKFLECKPAIVYSMWEGYLNPNHPAYNKQWDKFLKKYEKYVIRKHTSGHATPKALAEVITAAEPTDAIYPIHTECQEKFRTLNISDELKRKIKNKPFNEIRFLEMTEPNGLKYSKQFVDMKDSRVISKELLDEFCTGAFSEFRQAVINDKEQKYFIAFRGNGNPESIIIYRHNHLACKLSKTNEQYYVTVNFGHAKYTKGYYDKLSQFYNAFKDMPIMQDYLAMLDKVNPKNRSTCPTPPQSFTFKRSEKYDIAFVNSLLELVNEFIEDYFNPTKDILYADSSEKRIYSNGGQENIYHLGTKTDKKGYSEKVWQQIICNWLREKVFATNSGLYVYDLEFHQKYPSKEIRDHFINNGHELNVPDMLAVKFKKGEARSLVLIEVKSKKSCCEKGNSSIFNHMRKMFEYSCCEVLMKNRKSEALGMLKCYKTIGQFPSSITIPESFDNLPVERLLILTENPLDNEVSACQYYDEASDQIKQWMETYDFEVMLLRDEFDGFTPKKQ